MGSPVNLIILTDAQEETVSKLMLVLNSISFLTSLFVIITHLKFKVKFRTMFYVNFQRKYPSSLVLYLALASCLLSVFVILSPIIGIQKVIKDDNLCTLQGN
jgi:hypothetical protein